MEISVALIDKLARLSRLTFADDAEKEKIRTDLNKILQFVDQLNEVNTDGIEPLLHMSPRMNVLREDEVQGSISKEEALRNVPAKNEAFFLVPKVIKK